MKRHSLTMASLGFAGGTLVTALVLATPGADATQGQALIAGQINTETDRTTVSNTGNGGAIDAVGGDYGLAAVGQSSGSVGIYGRGAAFGIKASSNADGGTGLLGSNTTDTGIGVHGQVSGSGSGVFGEATGAGVGVNALSDAGVALQARSASGTALRVVGSASFSQSHLTTVPAGASSRTVRLAGVTSRSMVLATSQQQSAVFVRAAVPRKGRFTIQLTGKAPRGGLTVAYFVLN